MVFKNLKEKCASFKTRKMRTFQKIQGFFNILGLLNKLIIDLSPLFNGIKNTIEFEENLRFTNEELKNTSIKKLAAYISASGLQVFSRIYNQLLVQTQY